MQAAQDASEKSLDTVNLFAFGLGVCLFVAYMALTFEQASHIGFIVALKSLLVLALVLFLPGAFHGTRIEADAVSSEAILTIAVLGALAVLGLSARSTIVQGSLLAVVLTAGVVVGFSGLKRCFVSGRHAFGIVGIGALLGFALWSVSISWGSGYQNPLYYERIALGTAHIDTLFHAAIANMLQVVGIPSTGVDGAPYLPYHWGSHWVVAQFSRLMNVSPLDFYNVSYQILFMPLLFKGLSVAALSVSQLRGLRQSVDKGFLLLLVIATISFVPESILRAFVVWTRHLLLSESYLFALTFTSFAAVGIFRLFAGREASRDARSLAIAALALPATVLVAATLKISVAMLLVGLVLYLFLRLRRFHTWRHAALGLSMVVVFFAVLSTSKGNAPAGGVEIVLFHFLKQYVRVPGEYKGLFFLVHYLWAWLFFAAMLFLHSIRSVADFRRALVAGKLLEVEVLFIVSLGGFLPGAVLALPGGAGFYFSDVQRWMAVVFLLAYYPDLAHAVRERFGGPVGTSGGIRTRAGRGLLALTALVVIGLAALKVPLQVSKFVVPDRYPPNRSDSPPLLSEQELDRRTEVVRVLSRLGRLSVEDRMGSCIFVPRQNRDYWALLQRPGASSLIAPAVAGVPMVFGFPSEPVTGRGFDSYETGYREPPKEMGELRSSAYNMGCVVLHVLNAGASQLVSTRLTDSSDQVSQEIARPASVVPQ